MILWYLITIIFGLIVGSFLNVCIYRIPKGKSIIYPERSYCPKCNHTLSAIDNIPIFSYIFLRGRCRYCKEKISPRYIIVETLTAGIFVLILNRVVNLYTEPVKIINEVMTMFLFVGFLIPISFIDLETQTIPAKIVYPGMVVGLALSIYKAIIYDDFRSLIMNVLGGLGGALIILVIAMVGKLIFRKEAMGMGDVELMAMIGLFAGLLPHIPMTLLIAAFIGSFFGIVLILIGKKRMSSEIPFGPFLSIGALISLLYSKEILAWYRHIVGI